MEENLADETIKRAKQFLRDKYSWNLYINKVEMYFFTCKEIGDSDILLIFHFQNEISWFNIQIYIL